MADRFPLILNTSANQIQEIASGDTLDLSGTNIKGVGIITATNLSGNIIAGAGTSNIVAGIATITDLRVGGDTSFSEDLVVTGNARVTGILTVGTSSIILNDSANTIKVGTALTLGHTQGLQFHTQNLHTEGFEVNQINASGIITATGADINGDLDVDGHTNLDNVSVAGVTTFTGNIDANAELDVDGPTHLDYVSISGVTTHSDTVHIIDDKVLMFGSGGDSTIEYDENGTDQLTIAGAVTRFTNTTQSTSKDTGSVILEGGLGVEKNLSVGGNVSIGGTLTYEDVTNIDSVGIVTARLGLRVPDNVYSYFGTGNDLSIRHDAAGGNHSYIFNHGAGVLKIGSDTQFLLGKTSNANYIEANPDGDVKLFFNNNQKLKTTNTGVSITGTLDVAGAIDSTVVGADNTLIIETTSSGDPKLQFNASGSGGHRIEYSRSTNILSFTNGTSNRLQINAAGHTIPGTDSLYDLGLTGTRWRNVYADTLYGSGANLTSLPAQITFSNPSNNRILTSEGGIGVNAESTFTFDGSTAKIDTGNTAFVSKSSSNGSQTVVISSGSARGDSIGNTTSSVAGIFWSSNDDYAIYKTAGAWSGNYQQLKIKWQTGIILDGGTSYGLSGVRFDSHVLPVTNNNRDLGSSSLRWRNIYTNDLNLSNEGGKNDVDGTWGNYTIQEGENDLFLINNRSGKKYKFNLTEVN